MDETRFRVAQEIARIMESHVDIRFGDITKNVIDEQFDIVLCLNVLHHVADPVAAMRRLSELCCDTVIVEFYLPTASYQRRNPGKHVGLVHRKLEAINMKIRNILTQLLDKHPLVIVGEIPYHRTYYFNKKAFKNIFLVHNKLFSEIRFESSPYKNRMLAFCKVASQ